MNEVVWQRQDCVSTEVEDSLALLDLASMRYHVLNRTAAAVWQGLETPSSAKAIAASLCTRFDIGEADCEAAVQQLLGQLQERKLVHPAEEALKVAEGA